MIVTITGAFNNVGDHLIRDCAHRLLRSYVDREIVDINRRDFQDSDYERLNAADCVLLCGGPAYQRDMYPDIYALDLGRITTRLIPFGLGWKGKLTDTTENFQFTAESLAFIKEVHARIATSSVRDVLTTDVLARSSITNAVMTGCPAWYDTEHIEQDYHHTNSISSLVYSAPAVVDANSLRTLSILSQIFPNARKYLALHHGIIPHMSLSGARSAARNASISAIAAASGFKSVSLRADLAAMRELYDTTDLHIGYRVHAHILRLSRRRPSILIAEDQRAVSQTMSMGSNAVMGNLPASDFEAALREKIDSHLATMGAENRNAIATMRENFPVMRDFLTNMIG